MAPRVRVVQVGERGGRAPDAAAMLSVGLTSRLHIASVGRDAEGVACISLWDLKGAATELWKGAEPNEGCAADIIALSKRRLICLLPGQGVLEIDGRRSTTRWRADASDLLPARVFAVDGKPVAVFQNAAGETSFSAINDDSADLDKPLFAPPIAGPILETGQAVSLLLPDSAGRMVVAIDDRSRGFQLYRQGEDRWMTIARDGAARYAFNSVVRDGYWWGDKLALAVGLSSIERRRMLGFSSPGEILTVDVDGHVQILCGEARPSENGFMTPLIGAAKVAAWAQGAFTHLAANEDTLIAALTRDDGGAEIHSFTTNNDSEQLGAFDGVVCGVFCNENEFIVAVSETSA